MARSAYEALFGHRNRPKLARLIQQDRDLHRENMLAVEVSICGCSPPARLEEKRRRTNLTRLMQRIEERHVVMREAHVPP
jgi:hypothetical protein